MNIEISADEFKQIAFGVLEYFKFICEKYDIYYILSFGTVLGAVRHDGFIPWDDDIDVCVFRKDYQRLIDAFKKENNERFLMISTDVDPNYSLPHMKIVDTNTVLFQARRRNNFPLGIWIDVFSLDNVPDSKKVRQRYFKKLDRYQKIWSMLEFVPNNNSTDLRSKSHLLLCKMIGFMYHYDSRKWAIKSEKLARKYESCNTQEVGVLSFFPYDRNKSVFPRKMLSECSFHRFESGEFPIPKDYDKYLTKIYGDYMKLPPGEKRVTHHSYTVAFK